MNRTFAGDFDQVRALLWSKLTGQFDPQIDLVKHASFRFAFFTVIRMNAVMRKRYRDRFQSHLLSTGV